MSLYSEMMGSFIRTGNYPLEANYIFPTEEALKEFYSDELNLTTIHKGLLKIVENDGTGKQGLYWVTKKLTNDELEFTKLISGSDISSIFELLEDLETRLTDEIKNRLDSETAIWGTNDPTNVPEELNSLLDLASVITALKEEVTKIHLELVDSDDSIQKSLKTEVKALAGTEELNVVEYLKTLPYKSLTEVAKALNTFLNEVDSTTNQINTLPELKYFLEGYTDSDKLKHVLIDLQSEILGNPIPSEDFRTLRAIEDFVRVLKSDSENTDNNLQTELNQTQIGVGLSGDGSYNSDKTTYYLLDATSIMNALKILDSLMYKAISGITIQADNNDVVDLNVRKELEGYVIGAKLKLSNVLGNDLIKKDDGIYFNVKSTYNDGTLSLYANDKLIALHILGFSSLVETAQYDPTQEAIVIVFKLLSGEKQTITIPVGALVREWEVDNNLPEKVVELTRTTVVNGQDTLSADVRISLDKHNILKKVGNTLEVNGTSDSITHNDLTLSVVLEEIKTTESNNSTALNNKLDSEISRATAKEEAIETKISNLSDSIVSLENSTSLKDAELSSSIKEEVNRATEVENNLKISVLDLKATDSELRLAEEELETKVSNLSTSLSDTNHSIELETERATNAETNLLQRVESLEGELSSTSTSLTNEISRASIKETELSVSIAEEVSRAKSEESSLDNKIDILEQKLLQEIHLLSDDVSSMIADKADKSVIDTLSTNITTTTNSLNDEIVRASKKEGELQSSIQDEVLRAKTVEQDLSTTLATKVSNVVLEKVDDLTYSLLVDGANMGQIKIPEDQFLKSVEIVNGSTLRFIFKTDSGTTTTDLDISSIVESAISDLSNRVTTLESDKAPINSPTFTGIAQVEISPDAADSSQRIPSTNWVQERILEAVSKVSTDIFYTKAEIALMLLKKADLVDGTVPESQLPKLYIIEVE